MFVVPKFSSKNDPELWLYRYTKAASMNKWDEKTKLNYVDNCFKQQLQLWFMDQNFKTWDEFQTAFLIKFSKKQNIDKVVSNILNIKMLSDESINEYIDRYEKLRLKYNNHVGKTQKLMNSKNTESVADKTDSNIRIQLDESINVKDVEFVITPAGFLRYFIKGLQSKTMIRLIKTEKPSTIEEAYQVLREVYGSEEESDDDSDNHTISEDEGESEDDIDVKTPSRKSKKNSKSEEAHDKNPPKKKTKTESEMSELINGFKNMTLLIGELVANGNNGNKNNVKEKRITCWNCNSKDHYTRECESPCKYCQSSGNLHYQ